VSERPRPARGAARLVLTLTLGVVLFTAATPGSKAAAFSPLPLAYDTTFLSNLSAPDLAPGSSGTLSFHVADPKSFSPMAAVTLSLGVYAFNAFPGNATSSISTAGTPVLVTPTASSASVNLSLNSLSPGGIDAGSVGVATAGNTPSGTFAVRTALSFTANGTHYLLESRGWFTASAWAAATELPNGSTTLNLTVLGVSGVTAETAILVSSSSWAWALALILGASIVLIAAGAYVYFRRSPKSSSGAR
jgi:hypothetical protein